MPSASAPVVPPPSAVEDLDRHQLRPRGDADDAAPVGGGGDDPGDVRAVAVAVADVLARAGRREVDAVDVVDVAVAVVVDAVARDLAEVGPDVRRQVGVIELDPAVDDRDRDARALRERPGVRAGRARCSGATAHCSSWRASPAARATAAATPGQ